MKSKQGLSSFGTRFGRDSILRPLLHASIEDHLQPGALFAMCGEPGLGKTEALEYARGAAKRLGCNVRYLDLTNLTPDTACCRVTRECRSLERRLTGSDWALVCLDGVAPFDERCVYRMVTTINRLRNMGHCVMVALRPEAAQLIEACPDAYVVCSQQLCIDVSERMGVRACMDIAKLSAGIPFLAQALLVSEGDDGLEIRTGRDYHDALCRLMALSLRDEIIYDERLLRLTMLLLGSGTFTHLEAAIGHLDMELLQDICRYAPLFGVDMASSSFVCAGLAIDSWFVSCALALREACMDHPELCVSVAELLIKDGRMERAGILLTMCGNTEASVCLAMRHGSELINAGFVEVVRNALPLAMQYRCCSPQLRKATQVLLKLFENARLEKGDAKIDCAFVAIEEERHEILRIMLLLHSRLAWQGVTAALPQEASELGDALAHDLLLHRSLTYALVEGRAQTAYHLLVCGSQLSGANTIMNQLLEADLALTHVLMGLPCPQGRNYAFWPGQIKPFMLCYLPAIDALDAVWRRGATAYAMGEMDLHASKVGDELVLVHLLLAAAITSARRGATSHAAVKANRAHALAKRARAPYLVDATRIVCWAIRINAGDMPAEEEFANGEPAATGLKMLALLLEAIARKSDDTPAQLCDVALDRDLVWLLSAFLTGFGRLSGLLRRVMPPAWLADIENLDEREDEEAEPRQIQSPVKEVEEEIGHSIYVQLFGGLEVFVNGERLPQGVLERRRAKALVTYACSVPSRTMRRADIIDAIWPECDYDQGNKRIYAATNVINRALKSVDPECRFFAMRGTDHSLALDEACVHSDVKEFEELAHKIIGNEGNDEEVLSLVRGAAGLYEGDLYTPPLDAAGVIERRRIELRNLYADVLVAGAEAAFRSGSLRQSIRLCEQALLADDLREDANDCLVRSLDSCGRSVEARDRARSFAQRMANKGKK